MSGKHKRMKKPGAIGPDGLSHYARKCLMRETRPTVHSSEVLASAPVVPPQAPVTPSPEAVTEMAVFIGAGKPAQTPSGEYLYLPFPVLRKLGVHLKLRSLIECQVVPAEPGKKWRQIISLKPAK